jgi:acid stress-induced BolA-like protein IbaG/YrbA
MAMTDEPRSEASIGLAELISAVRTELEKADASRIDRAEDPVLELREVELEIQFEVTRTRAGDGIDFHVVAVGDAEPDDASRVQKLRVLYGPAFKLIELAEGETTGMSDWLRAP